MEKIVMQMISNAFKPEEKAKQHINSIRLDKFGIDENDIILQKNALTKDLRNAINHLSEGLYAEDIHFIFELIQNAEDNLYSPDEEPTLSFHLLESDPTKTSDSDGALLVSNNELGFNKRNVDALCSVGDTTKSKQDGYIGEKGIGFKSVFLVTARRLSP